MTPTALFATVAGAHLLGVASPGPDFAVVIRQTLRFGRSAGIWTALGIGTGITAHVAISMFGLGWIVERWPAFLLALRIGGALFLLWLGSRAIRAQPLEPEGTAPSENDLQVNPHRHYLVGLATNLLNAKALMFFIALCSAVITDATPTSLRLGLSAWMVGTTAAWFSFVAISLGHPAVRQRLRRSAHWIDRGMGLLLLVLGSVVLIGVASELL